MSKVTYTAPPRPPQPPGVFTVELTHAEAAEVALLLGAVIGGSTFALFSNLEDAMIKAGVSTAPAKSVTVIDRLLNVV